MKLTKIVSAAIVMAFAAVFSTFAHAQNLTYNEGDLLIGFENGGGNNYVVDLGSVSQILNDTTGATLTFNLSASDLSTAFGSGWASSSALQWGVIGASDRTSSIAVGGDTLAKNTLFYTQGRTSVGTQTTPPKESNNAGNNSINGKIQTLASDFQGETASSGSTAALQGTIEASSGSASWSGNNPSSNAFTSGKNIEQPATGATAAIGSVLDLYQLNAASTANVTPGSYLGNFGLSSSGVLTFNAAAVPEPSSYVLGALAAVTFLVLRRRKSISVQ